MEIVTGALVVYALWAGSQPVKYYEKPYFKLSEVEAEARQACAPNKFQISTDGYLTQDEHFTYFRCLK